MSEVEIRQGSRLLKIRVTGRQVPSYCRPVFSTRIWVFSRAPVHHCTKRAPISRRRVHSSQKTYEHLSRVAHRSGRSAKRMKYPVGSNDKADPVRSQLARGILYHPPKSIVVVVAFLLSKRIRYLLAAVGRADEDVECAASDDEAEVSGRLVSIFICMDVSMTIRGC